MPIWTVLGNFGKFFLGVKGLKGGKILREMMDLELRIELKQLEDKDTA